VHALRSQLRGLREAERVRVDAAPSTAASLLVREQETAALSEQVQAQQLALVKLHSALAGFTVSVSVWSMSAMIS